MPRGNYQLPWGKHTCQCSWRVALVVNVTPKNSVGGSDRQNEYRFYLLGVRRRLLVRLGGDSMRRGRLAKCCVGEYVRNHNVSIVRSSRILPDGGQWRGAYYHGVIHCGTMLCPVCGRQIARTRCGEVRRGAVEWLRSGGSLAMITLTVRHRAGDSLAVLDKGLSDAMEIMARNGTVRRLLRSAGMVGRIRSYEVQYGQVNGFHPHRHNLYFLARPLTKDEEIILKSAWFSAVQSSGLDASWEVGLNCRSCDGNIGDYLSKVSSISSEMTLGNLSKDDGARSGHYSPLQLLGLAARGQSWAGEAYVDEVLTLRGKHWVNWSRGLKARFGIAELSDDEARQLGEDEERRMEIAAVSGLDYQSMPWRSRGLVLDVVAARGLDDGEALRSAGLRAVPGRDGLALPRLVRVPDVPEDMRDMPQVPEDVPDVPEEVPEDMPDMPEAPAAGELPTADLPSPTNCVGNRPPPTLPDSPPLPFASDLLPYPLAPLGTIQILRRNNSVTDTNFNQGGNNHDN